MIRIKRVFLPKIKKEYPSVFTLILTLARNAQQNLTYKQRAVARLKKTNNNALNERQFLTTYSAYDETSIFKRAFYSNALPCVCPTFNSIDEQRYGAFSG